MQHLLKIAYRRDDTVVMTRALLRRSPCPTTTGAFFIYTKSITCIKQGFVLPTNFSNTPQELHKLHLYAYKQNHPPRLIPYKKKVLSSATYLSYLKV